MKENPPLPYNYDIISRIIPHRGNFLMIDRVIDVDYDKNIVRCVKNITNTESFFQGHFPNNPIMPGVLMIEAAAQTSIILAKLTIIKNIDDQGLFVFAGLDDVKFKEKVIPGDSIVIESHFLSRKGSLFVSEAKIFVNEKNVLNIGSLKAFRIE